LASVAVLALGSAPPRASEETSPEDDLTERVARVSEGALRFLPTPPQKAVHHHHNELRLSPQSLEDGWADLEQCHEHLDAVPRVEVVFRPEGIRKLEVTSASRIDRAWIEGPSVQLEGVHPGATLCVRAESRVLSLLEDGSYAVRNGPFMRRFLDGYYPMRVSMSVHYPCGEVQLASVTPLAQPGLSVTTPPCRVDIDAWFEGRLHTEMRFTRTGRQVD
jgi:hypothetical protein